MRDYLSNIDEETEMSKSSYDLQDVLEVEEFQELSKEIKMTEKQTSQLIDSIYYPYKQYQQTFIRKENEEVSAYAKAYQQWKRKPTGQSSQIYKNTLNQVKKDRQKQQIKKLIKKQQEKQPIYGYSNGNQILSKIRREHSHQVRKVLQQTQKPSEIKSIQPFESQNSLVTQVNTHRSIKQKQLQTMKQVDLKTKIIQMNVQKEILNKIRKINNQQQEERQKNKQVNAMKQQCFVNIISRPPNKNINKKSKEQTIIPDPSRTIIHIAQKDIDQSKQPQQIQIKPIAKPSPRRHYKLKVQEILKLPCKQFLLFYSQNYNQLVHLSTPQQLKQLNHYRDQSLTRQEAVHKLRKKVEQEGVELVQRLPQEMRNKIFKVLYEKEVSHQKYHQGKQEKY